MIKITIKTKKSSRFAQISDLSLGVNRNLPSEGVIHSFEVDRGDDFLSTLDKFLKMNKMDTSDILSIFVDCQEQEDSVSCRIVKASVEAIKLSK